MSFPLFLMLAAIVLKIGRIADRVDPQPQWDDQPGRIGRLVARIPEAFTVLSVIFLLFLGVWSIIVHGFPG